MIYAITIAPLVLAVAGTIVFRRFSPRPPRHFKPAESQHYFAEWTPEIARELRKPCTGQPFVIKTAGWLGSIQDWKG
jgi:hypothetical protein